MYSKRAHIIVFMSVIVIFFNNLSFAGIYPTYIKTLSSDYGPRAFFFDGTLNIDWHKGLDFPTPTGTPTKAIELGYVSKINVYKPPFRKRGDGNAVIIDSENTNYKITYKHLDFFIEVEKNGKMYQIGFYTVNDIDSEKPYDIIYEYCYNDNIFVYFISTSQEENNIHFYDFIYPGLIRTPLSMLLGEGEIFSGTGNTGASTRPHLHVEVFDTTKNTFINPLRILPFVNSWEMNVTIVYPTHLPGKDYYTPPAGTKEIAIRANVDSRYDYDLNKIEFFIDQNNPPQTLVQKISFDPRENASDDQIFVFSSDPVDKTGCYPRDNGNDDFAYKWDITGKSGDYYIQVRATDIQGCEECKYKSPVLHIKLGLKVKVQVIDSETGQPVEGAAVTLSNTQLAYNETETTAGAVVAAAAVVSSVTVYSESLPPGVAVFEDVQLNIAYNVLIKKQGYEDSDKDTITTNDSIIPTEDNQTITLALKPKPAYVVILHDTTTLDSTPAESEWVSMPDPDHRWSCAPMYGKQKDWKWEDRYQTAQGRLVGYGLERITRINLYGVSQADLYINDVLAPNRVWTKNPETEKIIPTRWKVVFNPGSLYTYGSERLQATAGGKSFVRSLALFGNVFQRASGGDGYGWTGTGQANGISIIRGNNQVISIADLPPTDWTVENTPCGYYSSGYYREFVALNYYYENVINRYLCHEDLWPQCEKIISVAPTSAPSYLPMKVRAVVEPSLSSEEKSILKDLGLPEQPQAILTGSQ